MPDKTRALLAERVIRAMRRLKRDDSLDRAQCQTELIKMGIPTGTAQRVLGGEADVRIGSIEAVAHKLRVPVAALLDDDGASIDEVFSARSVVMARRFDALPPGALKDDAYAKILFLSGQAEESLQPERPPIAERHQETGTARGRSRAGP